MDQSEITEGKRRVRSCLIEPLEGDGMSRTATSAVKHQHFLSRVESALCYLTEGELESLAETIARGAVECKRCKRSRADWPALVAIRNWAHDLRPRPPGYSPKTVSWMRSAAGARCWSEDPAVALSALRYLVKFPGVPSDTNGGMRAVRAWAETLNRDLSRARGYVEAGTAEHQDHAFLSRHEIALEGVRAMIRLPGDAEADTDAA